MRGYVVCLVLSTRLDSIHVTHQCTMPSAQVYRYGMMQRSRHARRGPVGKGEKGVADEEGGGGGWGGVREGEGKGVG